MKSLLIVLSVCLAIHSQVFAQDIPQTVNVKAGDITGLINAINEANASTGPSTIFIVKGDDGETEFIFSEPAPGFDNALPDITTRISIFGSTGVIDPAFRTTVAATGKFRLVKVTGDKCYWLC